MTLTLEQAMKSRPEKLVTIVSTLILASCSGGNSGSGPLQAATPPPPVVRSYSFAPGKAYASAGTTWDIIGVKTTLTGRFSNGGGNSYDTLAVDVTFAQDITTALPQPGMPLSQGGQLGVVIGFDSDNNPATGNFLSCDTSNRKLTPFEYFTDQGNGPTRLRDGNYSIVGPGGTAISSGLNPDPASEAVIGVSGNVLTETIFLPAIGVFAGTSAPIFGIDVSSFNGFNTGPNVTDCVPSDGRIELPVN